MRLLTLSLLVLAAAAAHAAPPILSVIPSTPVAGTPFTVRVQMAWCYSLTGVQINGSNIDVIMHFEPLCIATPPVFVNDIAVGPLPAGDYTVRLMADNNETTPAATQPLAIVAADIPALDTSLMILLAAVLGFIAIRSAAR